MREVRGRMRDAGCRGQDAGFVALKAWCGMWDGMTGRGYAL